MDDDLSDIRDRQDRLEGRVTHLETKVDHQASLRADMDNELGTIGAKLAAHQQSLNALQEVQGDHTRRLTRIEDKVTGVEGRLDNVESDLVTMKVDLVTVKVGVHAVLDLLDANLAKKGLAARLSGRFTRRRDDDTATG